MTIRISQRTVTFAHPFQLAGMEGERPAGSYVVETEEELLQDLSFPAYRRVATRLLLRGAPGKAILEEVIVIDPLELDDAQQEDRASSAANRN